MAKLYINPPELGPQKTYLTADVAADAASSTVENNDGFATDDYVVFGKVGEEKTEIVQLTGVTDEETLNHTTGPDFAHEADTPILQTDYNQVQISRADSETGTYSAVTTIDLDLDQPQTEYHDQDGDSSNWYKVRYFNDDSNTYSSYSAPIQAVGFASDTLGGMRELVYFEIIDEYADTYKPTRVERLLNSGARTLTLALAKLHTDALMSYTTQSLTSGTQLYDLPSDFISFRKVDIDFDGGGTYYRANFENESEGLPDTDYTTSDPRVFRRGTEFGIRPDGDITSSGTAKLWYSAYPARMTDDDDTHGLPYGAEDVIVPFALYRLLKGVDEDRSIGYLREYQSNRNDWLEQVSEGFQDYQPKGLKVRRGEGLYSWRDVEW